MILAKAKLTAADAATELAHIYEQAALYLAADRDLTSADLELLGALQRAFELNEASANSARTCAVTAVYRRVMLDGLADNNFSAADRERRGDSLIAGPDTL